MKSKEEIVEKIIGISPDYQYKAMRSSFWLKKNWHKNKFDVIESICGFSKNDQVLDLGTGSGNFEILFANSVKEIQGIDYNDEALLFLKKELKKRNVKNVHLTCADMRNLPLELSKKKYDLILSIDTIEHVSKKDGNKIIAWSKKRLTKNGRLIIITPNYGSFWKFLEPLLDILSFTPKMGKHQHLSTYTIKSLTATLKKNGFKVKKAVTFNLFSFISPLVFSKSLALFETRNLGNYGCLMALEARLN
jgi:ubiquinone/menaquinone biosynthesis C-methylase UbiE